MRADVAPIAATTDDFLRRLDGLTVGPSAREGVFEGAVFRHPDLGFTIRFPAGWKTTSTRRAVGAGAPEGDAMVVLTGAGPGTDPTDGLRALAKAARLDPLPASERLTINGYPAVRTTLTGRSARGPVTAEVTWIAYAGQLYRVTGLAVGRPPEALRPAWRETAGSFRALTPAERRAIREHRLRIVRARAGDTIETLVARTGSVWSAATAAVANQLTMGEALAGGRPIKVAMSEPYQPGR